MDSNQSCTQMMTQWSMNPVSCLPFFFGMVFLHGWIRLCWVVIMLVDYRVYNEDDDDVWTDEIDRAERVVMFMLVR